ncbi:MFS transporter [Aestuariibius sp. 2305UL40-4]|uniref:MFS transporter n=1 Tax=Aestuariibius violaceus TaxID=3234132 RepID=UPI00345EF585
MSAYSRPFVLSLVVVGILVMAQTILSFTLPLLAFDLNEAGTDLSLIRGAAFIPNILFAVFIGVINDRIRKRVSFRAYTALLLLSLLALWVGVRTDHISVPALMVFMIVFNGVGYALGNAHMTLIRLTVSHDRLSDATALVSGVHATITTVGPAIGGLALLWLGHEGVIGGLCLLMALACFGAAAVAPEETLPQPARFWPSLAEGWQVFRANRELVMMTIVVVMTNAADGAFAVALLLKLKADLLIDPFRIGIVLACAGAGSVVASLYAAKIRRKLGYRTAFFWPIWMLALTYLAVAGTDAYLLLCLLSFVEGALALFFNVGIWSYRQETVEAAHMGRVAGITGAIFKIGMPPVIILAGILSDTGWLIAAFALAAAINAAAALFLAYVAGWGWPRRLKPA